MTPQVFSELLKGAVDSLEFNTEYMARKDVDWSDHLYSSCEGHIIEVCQRLQQIARCRLQSIRLEKRDTI